MIAQGIVTLEESKKWFSRQLEKIHTDHGKELSEKAGEN